MNDPKRNWSSSEIIFPITVLCGYIHDQGRLEIDNTNRDEWNKLVSDTQGWWNYHERTGGNLQNFLDDAVIPNMQKRLTLLKNSHSYIGSFINYIIKHIKHKYPS